MELSLASPATGPADRVWFSSDGSQLYVRAAGGRVFGTSDFEKWAPAAVTVPPQAEGLAQVLKPAPEAAGPVRAAALNRLRVYAMGTRVWRSDDGGASWSNTTGYRESSIIGTGLKDLAVSPRDPDEVVVANADGVWRSLDGGLSWVGLNDDLPNLPVRRLLSLPQASHGLRVLADGMGPLQWPANERQVWRPASSAELAREHALVRGLSETLSARITAVAFGGEFAYAGAADGRLWVSPDRGRSGTWRLTSAPAGGQVEAIWTDPKDGTVALAALAGTGARVFRTVNGGTFWDDLTSDLPEGSVHGIVADRGSGFIYVAADRGVFSAHADLLAASPATNWTPLPNLPNAAAFDVKLDTDGNQLYAAVDGFGVYATLAPHRLLGLRVVNAADFSSRPAAPGSLLSVLGGRVQSVRAGSLNVPVLAASDSESQIQVPFEARGSSLALSLESGRETVTLGVALQTVSPAVFVDRDGGPMILNADTGLMLDAAQPAKAGGRVQILATGLGRVRPNWPTGVPGPLENPPQVVAQVQAYLDRSPVEVTRATLAPGYVGFYLVEVQLPSVVNAGEAELYLEADGQSSNRVRIYIEQ